MDDIEDRIFDSLCDSEQYLPILKFKSQLRKAGLRETDPRLAETMKNLAQFQRSVAEMEGVHSIHLDRDTFRKCVGDNIILISKAFHNNFIIPEFQTFCQSIDDLYWKVKSNTNGKVASYIPQLARYSADFWGVSICTIDGQRYSIGDVNIPLCLQSISKPLTYALALNEHSPDLVHEYVGHEPSGRQFNEIKLNADDKPHNPMINAGAIVLCSLLKQGSNLADRFDYTSEMFKKLAGNEHISFNNSVFLSERETADRNFALAYYLREYKCFPKGTHVMETLDFYFQLCSVEVTCQSGSVIAASLANGGICPITGERILNPYSVRNTLSLMHSCGMYDYSGQFAFDVGLPSKSGVSGGVMLVVPNVMGIFLWAPPLDIYGNSCKGIQFCEELVDNFNFHNYDNLRYTQRKQDPRLQKFTHRANSVVQLLFAAKNGDITALRRCYLSGLDMNLTDYDGRTALHVASAEGHTEAVIFLLEKCKVSPFECDRWDYTALDDAKKFHKTEVVTILEKYMSTNPKQQDNSQQK
ncbi:hypothetical protein LOTGIDRAFT_133855 [Lottia gigantea]|uniref:glutaminase n=1 Tax=Lottia gigantea TaxID=225164 RepID=V3ZLC8_LOTGI|nr:hypothetical protein LOTGIDRAFT_133855 [Lottia gigantea]ESO83195.1 hypothetical protein LOTGIDRAFT_133855 [Lottia gigantea]